MMKEKMYNIYNMEGKCNHMMHSLVEEYDIQTIAHNQETYYTRKTCDYVFQEILRATKMGRIEIGAKDSFQMMDSFAVFFWINTLNMFWKKIKDFILDGMLFEIVGIYSW